MSKPQDLKALLERVKKAEGADRELDADIWWILDHSHAERAFNNGATGLPRPLPPTLPIPGGLGRLGVRAMAPILTASIDAALALVERKLPEWSWYLRGTPDGLSFGKLWSPFSEPSGDFSGQAMTPPLALLAALLTALIEQEVDHG